jgi:hypothetical protein
MKIKSNHPIPRVPEMYPHKWPKTMFSMSEGRRDQIVGKGGFMSKLGWDNLEDAVILFSQEYPQEAQCFVDWLAAEPAGGE